MVAAEVLGRAVDNRVYSHLKRSLVAGRGEGVVYDGLDAARAGEFGDGAEVCEPHQGVRRRLGVNQFRVRADGCGEVFDPRLVNVSDLDAEARREVESNAAVPE